MIPEKKNETESLKITIKGINRRNSQQGQASYVASL